MDLMNGTDIELIIIDKNDKISYYQECEIAVDQTYRELLLYPDYKDSNLICVSFKRAFVSHDRFICIQDSKQDLYKYFLIFPDNDSCWNIIDVMDRNDVQISSFSSNEDLIREEFLIPITVECTNDRILEKQLQSMLLHFLEFYKQNPIIGRESNEESVENDRDTYELNTDQNEVDRVASVSQPRIPDLNNTEISQNDYDFTFQDAEFSDAESYFSQSSYSNHQNFGASSSNAQLRESIEYVLPSPKENEKSHSETRYMESSDEETAPEQILAYKQYLENSQNDGNKSNDEIDKQRRSLRKRAKKDNGFYNENHTVTKRKSHRKNVASKNSTICQNKRKQTTSETSSNNELHIYKPNYKIITRNIHNKIVQRLVIFDSDDESLCRELTWNARRKMYTCNQCIKYKVYVSARIIKDENAKEYVLLNGNKHKCETKKFVPESVNLALNVPAPNTSNSPEYKIIDEEYGGKNVRYLYVYDKEGPNFYRKYTWINLERRYKCNKCVWENTLNVWAKVIKNKNGDEYLELGPTQHTCKPLSFSSENNSNEDYGNSTMAYRSRRSNFEVIDKSETPEFKLITKDYRGKDVQHLIIFDSDNRSLCYDLTWNHYKKKFLCMECMRKHQISVWAKFVKDENGEESLGMNSRKHQCKPQKFIS